MNDPNALFVDLSRIRGVYPVLGVCYGAQFLAHTSGGKVESADTREYGRANLAWHDENDPLMRGVRENSTVWMSHGDSITVIPSTFTLVASTHEVKTAAFISRANRHGVYSSTQRYITVKTARFC